MRIFDFLFVKPASGFLSKNYGYALGYLSEAESEWRSYKI